MKHDYDDYDALASMLTAGSQWQNKRGKLLTVLAIANDNLPERYADLCPISVVYMDEQGRVFSLRADVFLHNYEYVLVDEVFAEYIDQIYAYNAGEIDALGLASSKDARDFMDEAEDVEEAESEDEIKSEVKPEVKVEKRPLTLAEQLVKPAARFFDSNDVERSDYAEAFAGFEFADYSEGNRTIKLIFNADANLSYSDFNNGRFIIDDDLNDVHEEYRLGTVYYCGNEYADGNLRKIVLVNYPYLVSMEDVTPTVEVAVDNQKIEQIVPDNTVENQENEELISQVVSEAEETAEYEPQGFVNGEPVADTVEATEETPVEVEQAVEQTETTEAVEVSETAEVETEQLTEQTTEATEVSADAEVSIEDVEVVSNFPETHVDIPQPTVNPQQNTALSDALAQAQQMTIAHRVVK